MRSLIALCLFLGLLTLTVGCGGGDKAVIPETFKEKPDRPPSAAGVPGPTDNKKGKGPGAAEQ